MKRSQMFVVGLFVLSLLMVPCSAFAFFGFDLGVGYWQQTPSGTLSYKGTGVADTIDLKSDLNYDTKSNAVVRAKVELPLILPNIYLMYTPMSFDGTGSKTVPFSYGGQTFNANVPVQSKLDLNHYDLALFYPIPFLKTATLGKLNAELGINIRNIAFEGTIRQDTLNYSASKSMTLYVPMIYVGVQVKPTSLFAIEVEARGLGNSDNHYYDYLGRLRINPLSFVFIDAGYRAEDVKLDTNDVKAAVKFSGPFAEVGLHF